MASATVGTVVSYDGNGSTSETTKTLSYTVTSGENKMLVIGVSNASVTGITSATWNGTAMTAGTLHTTGGGNHQLRYFWLANPAVGTHDIVVNFGSTAYINIGAFELTNSAQGTPDLDVNYEVAAASSITHNFTTVNNNELVVQIIRGNSQVNIGSYGSGQTERWKLNSNGYQGLGNTAEKATSGSNSMIATQVSGTSYMTSVVLGFGYVAPSTPSTNSSFFALM